MPIRQKYDNKRAEQPIAAETPRLTRPNRPDQNQAHAIELPIRQKYDNKRAEQPIAAETPRLTRPNRPDQIKLTRLNCLSVRLARRMHRLLVRVNTQVRPFETAVPSDCIPTGCRMVACACFAQADLRA